MGLALEVGRLADLLVQDEEGAEWFRQDINKLNVLLEMSGLRPHTEPRELSDGYSFSCSMMGYGGLHHLRRVAVHLEPKRGLHGMKKGKLPAPMPGYECSDPLLDARYLAGTGSHFRHLIDHSDCEGYYVPQDFRAPLCSDELPGGIVGSVQRLHEECTELARAIGIPEDLDPESDEVMLAASEASAQGTGWRGYGIATYTCLQLMHACQASIKSGALLVFA